MRGLASVLLIFVVLSLLSFMALSENSDKIEINKSENIKFKTFTSAVCEEKADVVHCRDELFVNCNGIISRAESLAECNGIKLDVPKATGAATFDKGWKDPRI